MMDSTYEAGLELRSTLIKSEDIEESIERKNGYGMSREEELILSRIKEEGEGGERQSVEMKRENGVKDEAGDEMEQTSETARGLENMASNCKKEEEEVSSFLATSCLLKRPRVPSPGSPVTSSSKGVRRSARLASTARSAQKSATARMEQRVTTSMEQACVTQASKGPPVRTGSVQTGCMAPSETNTAPETPATPSATCFMVGKATQTRRCKDEEVPRFLTRDSDEESDQDLPTTFYSESESSVDSIDLDFLEQGMDPLLDHPSSEESSDEDWVPEDPPLSKRRHRRCVTTPSPTPGSSQPTAQTPSYTPSPSSEESSDEDWVPEDQPQSKRRRCVTTPSPTPGSSQPTAQTLSPTPGSSQSTAQTSCPTPGSSQSTAQTPSPTPGSSQSTGQTPSPTPGSSQSTAQTPSPTPGSSQSTAQTPCPTPGSSQSTAQTSPAASTPAKGTSERGRGSRSSHTASTSSSEEDRWHDVDESDTEPPQPAFKPARAPGPQVDFSQSYTPLHLFQLFMSTAILQTVVNNTNTYAFKKHEGLKKPWRSICLEDLNSFLALVIYMGIAKLHKLTDYWRISQLYSLALPPKIMSCRKFLRILYSLHLSDPQVDTVNEQMRGTAAFDRLCKIRPMYDSIREACLCYFQPGKNIAIDERMVASKARISMKQKMKDKPTKWGYKLFVLADSLCGYTWNFFVYEGKTSSMQGSKGLSYDSVMTLVTENLLGSGYRLFVDNFYTSPTLFHDLQKKGIQACGTIRANRIGFPKTLANALPKNAPRGSLRWIRDSGLLFVQWKDTREVALCSSMHKAYEGDTVKRKVKGPDGQWSAVDVPVPAAVKDYNQNMGGVDYSDAMISYYNVLHKTKKWYKTFFYHFVDIAIVNAYVLHKELAKAKNKTPLTQIAFRETLVMELFGIGSDTTAPPPPPAPAPPGASHKPKYLGDSTNARRHCKHCHMKTPVACATCGTPLCFVPQRDCFNHWHDLKNL